MASPKNPSDNAIKGGVILIKICEKIKENLN